MFSILCFEIGAPTFYLGFGFESPSFKGLACRFEGVDLSEWFDSSVDLRAWDLSESLDSEVKTWRSV